MDTTIPWPEIIRKLVLSGLTQPQIAEACKCGQSTISDMLNGKTTDPRTSLGLRLLAMARSNGIDVPAPVAVAAGLQETA